MEQASLRRHILENTILWLLTNLVSLAIMVFVSHQASVGSTFLLAFANLTAVCMLLPARVLYHFKKWQQRLMSLCVALIIYLPCLLLFLFKRPVFETPLFSGGWLMLGGLLAYVYLAMLAVLALSYRWLTRRSAGSQIQA